LSVRVGDLARDTRLGERIFGDKPVEVFQQLRLAVVVGAGEPAQIDEALNGLGQATVKVQPVHR
jgi:hypothetical protein